MTEVVPANEVAGVDAHASLLRVRAIVILLVVLVAAGVADRVVGPPRPARASEPPVVSQAAADDALGSTWYCPAGTASAAVGDSEVIIANPLTRTATGTITVFPSNGPRQQRAVTVAPAARTVVHLRDVVNAPFAGALVELDRGGVSVDHDVSGPLGFAVGPCATRASTTWYLAQGATTKTSTLELALFNPFPDDAIVDLSFATEQGPASPSDLQGLVVAPRSLLMVDIGNHVRRREDVSTSVVARRGRVVAEQLATRNDPGQKGMTLELAAPRAAPVWTFPEGVVRDGTVERFHLYAPGDREARVDIEITLDAGVVEPISTTVPAGGRVTIVANEAPGMPKGVGHSATVRSLDDVPIVAARSLDATGARNGRTSDLGATASSTTWLLAAGVATPGVEEWVVAENSSDRPANLSVTLLQDGQRTPLDRLGGLQLAPGARRGYRINDAIASAGGALLVASTEPIVVERALYRVGRPGISASLGVPLTP